jgi:hypothetical protein
MGGGVKEGRKDSECGCWNYHKQRTKIEKR